MTPAVDRDVVHVYFHDGDASLDFSLYDNGKSLNGLVGRMASDTVSRVIAISVVGNSSPTGTDSYNRYISRKRAEGVLEYLRSYVEIPDSLVSVVADGVDWDGLAEMVEKDTTLQMGGGI